MREVMFPNEIWMEIFKYVDRQTLMELRLVCRNFYDMIEERLNKDPEWEHMAFSTIPFEFISLTMQRANPYYLITHCMDIKDPALWRSVYLSSKKWQTVLVNPETKHSIIPESARRDICGVCTFDKYIAVAFGDGSIENYTTDDINDPFYTARQDRNIKQIEFWYSNGEVLLVTVGEDSVLRFWDLQNKVEITTKGFLANSISSGECRHFCIGEINGTGTSYKRVGDHITAGLTKDLDLWDGEVVVVHGFEGENMTAMTWDIEDITRIYRYRFKIEDGNLTEFIREDKYYFGLVPENLKQPLLKLVMPTFTYVFVIGKTSIGTTHYHDRWNEYSLVEHLGCHVTSVWLHARVLMFGCEDGSVHLLFIEYDDDVVELEDLIRKARKIEVDSVPIIGITILEVDKKPCIVAYTKQKVHLLNFF